MEYKVVLTSSTKEFEEKVNDLIRQGWEPLGGVAICRSQTHAEPYVLAQALIKK
jgi:hypothetical protein